ncbi:hypothetical protein [Marinospirillum insulare]|uniref:Uncharacterized protein n=1 Tax=Marinospirillum insulare TaxID=217169 RepID=A0ABQ5ZYU1_9GAMM|nr:hypothetical protein [Marinospirillum insulare]GLR64200.1 hypothetical protein GCM10007878_16380 [Marinospirillum insulare]
MSLPSFMAVEAAAIEEGSFPVSMAWSLPDGSIKQALIQPDEDWLEDATDLTGIRDLDLTIEAYSAAEVVRELLYDQLDDAYYVTAIHPQEGWLLKLFASAGQEIGFELLPASELCADVDEWSEIYQDNLHLHGLDPERAEDQVRALLETHVLLTGDQPDE